MRKATKSGTWKLCSEYNRRKAADADGYTTCVSCGKRDHWKDMDAGHFIPRARGKAVYWLPLNIHSQCPGCNRFGDERAKISYTLWMIDNMGRDVVDYLESESRTLYRERQVDIQHWHDYYKKLLEGLNNGR